MSTFDTVVAILGTHLGLGDRAKSFTPSTLLLGAVPELDSMAIVAVLTAFEERFDLIIADDEIDA